MAIPWQALADFLHALASCLEFLGGVPMILVPDNFKAAVIKADRYEPDINRALEDFASHYGIAVVPTRAGKPKDKARVENQVKILNPESMPSCETDSFLTCILSMRPSVSSSEPTIKPG